MNESILSQRCRACLEQSERMYPLVGIVVNVDVDIATMISYCIGKKLALDEDLPNSVCIQCFKTVRIAYNFLQQFNESQDKLLSERKATQVNFSEMELDMTYSISEDGTELIEEKNKYALDEDFDHDDNNYVDSDDFSLNVSDLEHGNFDLSVIHSYAERSNDRILGDSKVDFISKGGGNIKTEIFEDINIDLKEEIDSDSFVQYVDDPGKGSNDITSVLVDTTDPTSFDKFIIVNEPDEEVKQQEKPTTVKQAIQIDKPVKYIYTCPLCNTVHDRLTKFNDHLLQHDQKVIVCNKCPNPIELNVSQYLHHYRQFHRYQCYICDKTLTSSYGYRYHMTQHENIRKYKCPLDSCTKSFFLYHLLKKHMRTHSETIKYTCNLCKAAFRTYDTFRYHQKTHDGKRNHLCTLCGRAFFQAVHLRDHMFRHIGLKRFVCDSCGHPFTTNSQLKKHFKHCSNPKRIKLNK